MGVSLVEAYEHLGIELYKPYLRAQMENDMKLIAQGVKGKDEVLRGCVFEMNRIFHRVKDSTNILRNFLIKRMQEQGAAKRGHFPVPEVKGSPSKEEGRPTQDT